MAWRHASACHPSTARSQVGGTQHEYATSAVCPHSSLCGERKHCCGCPQQQSASWSRQCTPPYYTHTHTLPPAMPVAPSCPGILNGGVLSTLLDCHGNWTAAIALMDRSCLPKPPLTLTASMLVRVGAAAHVRSAGGGTSNACRTGRLARCSGSLRVRAPLPPPTHTPHPTAQHTLY